LTLETSDSLNATDIVSVFVLTISANPELEPLDEDDEDDEPPRLPAVAAPPAAAAAPEDPDDDELEEPLEEPPLDTASPGVRLESDAIVPLVGAYSLVSLTPVSALCTAASALYTAAWAEAMLPGDGVVVVVVVFALFDPPDPLPDPLEEEPDPDPRPLELGVVVVVGRDELGPIVVTVLVVVFVIVVVVPPAPVFGFLVLPEPDEPGRYAANSTVPPEPAVKLVSLVDPDDPDPDDPDPDDPDPDDPQSEVSPSRQFSWSCAAVRLDSACESVRFADVGSRSARSWPPLTC